MDYLLVFLSVVLLSLGFVMQKFYQKMNGPDAGISFTIYSGLLSLLTLFLMNVGTLSFGFSWYSLINAAGKALCFYLYTILGFRIMYRGCVALYMLFLMSGGMVLPVVWGWLFLDEWEGPSSMLRAIGVLLIILSIALTKSGERKTDKKLILPLLGVFFLNGGVSILSKLHQIQDPATVVSTPTYALISGIFSVSISFSVALLKQPHPAEAKGDKTKKSFLPKISLKLFGMIVLYSILGCTSNILQLNGAKNLPASVLYPIITGGTIVFTGIMALVFFGEKPSRKEWVGIALCTLSTFLFL